MIRNVIASVLVLAWGIIVPACGALADGGLADGESVRRNNDARPILMHHYDCDGVLDSRFTTPAMLSDDAVITLSTPAYGLSYFTIYTDYITDNGTASRKAMHFVFGSMNREQAKVLISGRIDQTNHETALVRLESGFLWVSSSKPKNWELDPPNYERGGFLDPGNPGRPNDSPIVGWSLYTLIRSQFTWAGAEATEYIYWMENKARGQEQVVLYNLEDTTTKHRLTKLANPKDHVKVSKDQHSRYRAGRGLGKAKPNQNTYDLNFVKYVSCRVGAIRRHISNCEDCCKASHDACAP